MVEISQGFPHIQLTLTHKEQAKSLGGGSSKETKTEINKNNRQGHGSKIKNIVRVFDADELQDFIQEVSEAFRLTDISHDAWDMLDAIIHEWKESAIAINSPELAAAFNDETEEISLTPPINKSGL